MALDLDMVNRRQVIIYTDGACSRNPGGPGGLGVVMLCDGYRKEISEGYRSTTNNRMELLAAIRGIEALIEPCDVRVISDSKYLVQGMTDKWPHRWRSLNWRLKANGKPAKNVDLWTRLLDIIEGLDVAFEWVRGHSGVEENERCDVLASLAVGDAGSWLIDEMFEKEAPVQLPIEV